MGYKWGICSECGQPKIIVNKRLGLCALHDIKRKAKIYAERRKEKAKQGLVVDKTEMAKFFKYYWEKHTDRRCFETGEPLYYYKSYYLHHLLEKQPYPQLAFKEDNIVYLSHLQHSLWHSLTDSERQKQMPKTYKRYLYIKNKYNVN